MAVGPRKRGGEAAEFEQEESERRRGRQTLIDLTEMLPDEVLAIVLSYVNWDDLLAVLQASQRLRAIGQDPVVLRNVLSHMSWFRRGVLFSRAAAFFLKISEQGVNTRDLIMVSTNWKIPIATRIVRALAATRFGLTTSFVSEGGYNPEGFGPEFWQVSTVISNAPQLWEFRQLLSQWRALQATLGTETQARLRAFLQEDSGVTFAAQPPFVLTAQYELQPSLRLPGGQDASSMIVSAPPEAEPSRYARTGFLEQHVHAALLASGNVDFAPNVIQALTSLLQGDAAAHESGAAVVDAQFVFHNNNWGFTMDYLQPTRPAPRNIGEMALTAAFHCVSLLSLKSMALFGGASGEAAVQKFGMMEAAIRVLLECGHATLYTSQDGLVPAIFTLCLCPLVYEPAWFYAGRLTPTLVALMDTLMKRDADRCTGTFTFEVGYNDEAEPEVLREANVLHFLWISEHATIPNKIAWTLRLNTYCSAENYQRLLHGRFSAGRLSVLDALRAYASRYIVENDLQTGDADFAADVVEFRALLIRALNFLKLQGLDERTDRYGGDDEDIGEHMRDDSDTVDTFLAGWR